MDEHKEIERPPRRHVRVNCALKGAKELEAFSSNISESGLYIRVPSIAVESLSLLSPGSLWDVSFVIPDTRMRVACTTEVVWTDPDDYDVGGRLCLGVGLRIVDPTSELTRTLHEFVDRFRYSVLVVDDEPENLTLLERILGAQYRVVSCLSAGAALDVLSDREIAVVITDERMPKVTGLEFLARVAEEMPHTHMIRIVVSGFAPAQQLEDFINLGKIFHFMRKPVNAAVLRAVVGRAVDAYAKAREVERCNAELEETNRKLTREVMYLRRKLESLEGFEGIIGRSPALRETFAQLEQVKQTAATVHLAGETGTGKELVARILHRSGSQRSGPFVAFNCASMSESLQASTLFGHVKGAFTGAVQDQAGIFRTAHGGTLFFDEVADLSPAVQGSLLRALQEGEIVPVGGSVPIKVNVRVISASHKDLRHEMEAGRFRADLYFRLVVVHIRLPPLRARRGDVALLAQHFLDLYCDRHNKDIPGFSVDAMRALERYAWPGNVRELQNEVERLVILARDPQHIAAQLLTPSIRGEREALPDLCVPGWRAGTTYDGALDSLSRALISRALQESNGTIGRAAELLGMERSRLGKLKRKLEIP